MAENSKIEWTHHTFNPWRGCTKVSPGCANCYADAMSHRNPKVLGVWGPQGNRVVAADSYWKEPLRWDREAAHAGERRRVFCASLADVFEAWEGPMLDTNGFELSNANGVWPKLTMGDVRTRLFRLVADTPHLDWLMLSKRTETAAVLLPFHSGCAIGSRSKDGLPVDHLMGAAPSLPNIWAGTSVEDRARKDRIDAIRKVDAYVRFLSIEPLLEDLGQIDLTGIHWAIVGGESGPNARPMHPDWVRSLRDQCLAAGVAFFFKQFGDWAPDPNDGTHWFESREDGEFFELGKDYFAMNEGVLMRRVGKKAAGRLLDGREWSEFPAIAGKEATRG